MAGVGFEAATALAKSIREMSPVRRREFTIAPKDYRLVVHDPKIRELRCARHELKLKICVLTRPQRLRSHAYSRTRLERSPYEASKKQI